MAMLFGRKIGMTRYFTEDGMNIPVTVLQVGPCVVTQVKTGETDGYEAVQVGFDDLKPRRSTMQMIGHDAKASTAPKRFHGEFRTDDCDETFEVGQVMTVDTFANHAFVDITGTSKGKGFQGPMKRHNFRGQLASHGVERKHRSAGSIGGHATNLGTGPKIKKGKRMAGQMGNKRHTSRSLEVISIDADKNLMIVKGAVPGPNRGMIQIKTPTRLYKPKARKQAEKMKG